MIFPMTAEDFISKHPEYGEIAKDECFEFVMEHINQAYYAGLNGEENRWSKSPSNYRKDGLTAEICNVLCLFWYRSRQAYFQGMSDREALQ